MVLLGPLMLVAGVISEYTVDRLCSMSVRAELARLVLRMLKAGQSVPTKDALQLRNWAVHPCDTVLPLDEIARRILSEERDADG